MPYSLVFDEGDKFDIKELIEYIINFLFVVDLVLMFFSAYYDDNGVIVYSYKTIAMSYLKGFLLIDLVTCFPFNLVITSSGSSAGAGGSFDRISGLLKIPKLMRMVRIGKVLKFKERLKGTNLGYQLRVNNRLYQFLGVILSTIIVMHLAACLWSGIGMIESDYPDTWI